LEAAITNSRPMWQLWPIAVVVGSKVCGR